MTEYRFQRRLLIAAGALLAAGLACSAPGGTPTDTVEAPVITPTPVGEVTAAPTEPSTGEPCSPPMPDASIPDGASWQVYCDEVHGFAFRYPAGTPGAAAGEGNLFLPITAGTNLTEKYVSVTTFEGSVTCESPNATGYAPGTIPSETVSFNGIDFYKQSGLDAGAGNFYDWAGYSNLHGELCVSLTFIMHSNSPGVFETPPAEFDKAAESAVFDQVMATFTFFTPGEAAQGPAIIPTAEGSLISSTDCDPPAASGPDAELIISVYCDTQHKFGFRYPPVGDSGYSGEGPLALPFEVQGDLVGKYLDVASAQDQIGCFSAWAQGIAPDGNNTENLTINNNAFVRMEGAKTSATGLYEQWTAYSTSNNNLCLIMTFVLESTSQNPTYDRAAESAIFETIVGTLTWY